MSKTPEVVWDVKTSRWVKPEDLRGSLRRILNQSENRINSMTKPQYDTMTGQELLAAYNAMSGSPRKSKFHTREDGVVACEKLWETQVAVVPAAAPKAEKKKKAKVEAAPVADAPVEKPKKNGNGAGEKTTATKPAKTLGGSARLALTITLNQEENPRRAATDAFRHYEAMRGDITVGDYLAKFKPEDRRKAAQWLSNTVRDKFVRVA